MTTHVRPQPLPGSADDPARAPHRARRSPSSGCRSNELRASYFVGYYLQRHGYRVIPVNPRETEILGETVLPEPDRRARAVDIVNVFRAPDALPGIAARSGRDRRRKRCGASSAVINEEGARIAEAGGLTVVMDRCLKVEHARYVGRMHWLGFNTQRITSVRGGLQ